MQHGVIKCLPVDQGGEETSREEWVAREESVIYLLCNFKTSLYHHSVVKASGGSQFLLVDLHTFQN